MRERTTYILPKGRGVDPKTLDIQDAGLLGPQTESVREDRLTFSLDEIPSDLSGLLANLEDLHIHWTSPVAYDALEPLVARTSPGFHLSVNPRKGSGFNPVELCNYLSRFGRFDCDSPQAFVSSSQPKASRFPAYKFYQYEESLSGFQKYAVQEICPKLDSICAARLRGLEDASTLDVSFEAASGKLKVTALWPLDERVINVPRSATRRVEVGVLTEDAPRNLEPHEIGLSGHLTVLGEHTEPSATLFAVPARHRSGEGEFYSQFITPTGLHPNLELRFESVKAPDSDDTCRLFTYLTLPKTLFADQYQFGDDLFLKSKNLTALTHTTLPVDLEAPAYATDVWGSNILLEVAKDAEISTVEIPLHLRYLEPSSSGLQDVKVPYPVVFWACNSSEDAKFSNSPFDKSSLGYDLLFDDAAVFWHVKPKPVSGSYLTNRINVPVLRDGSASWVELGTGAAVIVGCAWVLFVLVQVFMRREPPQKDVATKKTQ